MNIIILDGSVMTSRERAYKHIARELRFPEYFGKNLDALYDLLTERAAPTMIEFANTDAANDFTLRVIATICDACKKNPSLQMLEKDRL